MMSDTNLKAYVNSGDLKTTKHWKSDDPIPSPVESNDLNQLKKQLKKLLTSLAHLIKCME